MFTGSGRMHNIDAAIIIAYLGVIFVLGWWKRGPRADNEENFLIAGRKLTLPAFVASLVSTWYGGILGVGEFSYRFGISNWLVFGIPYYLYALIFAVFLARRARQTVVYSVPDQLHRSYGKKAAVVGSIFIFLITLPAPYMLMMGILLQLFFPMPLWSAVLLASAFSLLYIYRSGLLAVIRTDVVQFLLMFSGFIILVFAAYQTYGGLTFLQSRLPETHWQWHGGNSPQYIFVWYIIAMTTLIDPNFYQRCYAARTESTARKGILISILFWIFFDFLTTSAGLYARALLPNLNAPAQSYPELAKHLLPPGLLGLFYVALMATIMSTLDSFFFVAAMTIGRDFWARWRNSEGQNQATRYTRIGMISTLILSVALALMTPSVVDIWYQLGSVATPALLLPLLTSFSQRFKMSPQLAVINMIAAGGLSAFWLIGTELIGAPPLGLEPIYPGMLLSLALYTFKSRRVLFSGEQHLL